MKVVHVDSARGWRGGQNQVLLSVRGMAGRGHQVLLACQTGGALDQRARAAGVDPCGLHFQGDLSPLAVAGLGALLRHRRPQVVQAHDPHALACAVLARPLAPPFALVATRRVDFALHGRWSRWKHARAARVIAVSAAVRAVLLRDGVPAEAVRLVYEGVPDRAPAPGGAEALRALGVPAGAPVVGNVAALAEHKDQATLLRAARLVLDRLPHVRFVIVGDGPLRAPLLALHGELGLGTGCVFTGFRDDVERLLAAFDVFCLSSHMEGLGTSLLDAMCFGRPVVATAAGGIPEVVEDGVSGRVVPPRDPAALAAALIAVLDDADGRAAMGRAGRRRFEEHFTDGRMVEETLRVYEELP